MYADQIILCTFFFAKVTTEKERFIQKKKKDETIARRKSNHLITYSVFTYIYIILIYCHVINANVTCKHANDEACGDKAGVIVGYVNSGTVSNCTATKCAVAAGRDAGQIVGAAKTDQVTNCSATNVTVTATEDCTGENIRNDVIGRVL